MMKMDENIEIKLIKKTEDKKQMKMMKNRYIKN